MKPIRQKNRLKPIIVPFITGLVLIGMGFISNRDIHLDIQNMPSLPRPIAEETVMITAAGQSTDAYIVKDIANQLMIHNYFIPQADHLDFEGIKTLVFVAGNSAISEKILDFTFEDEKARVLKLLKLASEKDLKIILVFIGGSQRRDEETEWFLEQIGEKAHYIISTSDGDRDQFLYQMAGDLKIPITLVNALDDISEPFASAFR